MKAVEFKQSLLNRLSIINYRLKIEMRLRWLTTSLTKKAAVFYTNFKSTMFLIV